MLHLKSIWQLKWQHKGWSKIKGTAYFNEEMPLHCFSAIEILKEDIFD